MAFVMPLSLVVTRMLHIAAMFRSSFARACSSILHFVNDDDDDNYLESAGGK